ncbi:hypothetical protein MLD38_020250 [Melastoma candidum]|uniref:Uncharacterized protein n=1 Tax=Melastoma candidum TaxID=119954 RepID=A0ACB9QCU5_9MYRT|nr:hypothetical protein MLD38_020250 [Melastoma candidum]
MSGVGGGGGGAGSSRVAIPNNLRKTIQHIKEITTCQSEEEIYAMLKECSMDPNETTQKLLFQDTFHEVKRRRDRKKENPPKETPEPRRQLGPPGRGGRGGRSNYLPRNFQSDAGDGRDAGAGKENGSISGAGPTDASALSASGENKLTPAAASSAIITYSQTISGIADAPNTAAVSPVNLSEMVSTSATTTSHERYGAAKIVLGVPSCEAWPPSAVGIIKRQAGSTRSTSEPEPVNKVTVSGAPEDCSSLDREKVPIKFPEGENSRSAQTDHHSSTSSQGLSTGSRPQSNYNSRSLHLVGSQKVTQNKEWKPKPSNQNVSSRSETIPDTVNPAVQTQESSSIQVMEETKPQKKMEGLNLPQRPPVILPRHIHIPETEKINFSFGSFDASFSTIKLCKEDPEDDGKSTAVTEISHGVGGAIELSERSESLVVEDPKIDEPQVNLQSQEHGTEIVVPCEVDSSSGTGTEHRDSKQQDAFVSGSHQYPVIHTSPNYNFGIVPQIIGGQIASVENSDPQERDISRLPSFVIPQPLDPASYYAQIYRSSLDGDCRLSPFTSHEIATRYNDYAAALPQQSSQPTQEGGSPLVLSTSGPTPVVTQAAGLMQSSIAMSQPPLPVFRPPAGVHISPPYHQNYIPYGPYFANPFYVPPPTIPQYMPNGAFPQQPQGAGLFPAPPSAAAQAGNSTTADELSVSKFRESNMYVGGQQNEGSRLWVANPGRDMTSLATTSFYNIPTAGSATNVYQQQQHQQQHSQVRITGKLVLMAEIEA